MVQTLAVDGQSSDESDGESHVVKVQEWRSSAVKAFLRYIDSNRSSTGSYGNPIAGGRPRNRHRPHYAPTSARTALAALPRNFYDDVWYDSLTEMQQDKLKATPAITLPLLPN